MSFSTPRVVSVNVGGPRTIQTPTRSVTSAIWKVPVAGRVRAYGNNLEGDVQVDRENHGGEYKAVYAYAVEDLAYWSGQLRRSLAPGAMGENLTLEGIDPNDALIGERWAIGSTLLEVTEPRSPCFRLGLRHDDPKLVRAFALAERPGAYFRILEPGDIGAGDAVEVVWRPDHDVTIRLASRAWLKDRSLAPRLLEAPQLPPAWKHWLATDVEREVAFE